MRLPIQYALTYPKRIKSDFPRVDFFSLTSGLTFEKPDLNKFRNLALAYQAMDKGGNMPCILNAANEVVVRAFLEDRCEFVEMSDIIETVMSKVPFMSAPTYEDYVQTDTLSRRMAEEMIR